MKLIHGSLVFLGTGASLGVPMYGCECSVCKSTIPLNKRLRSSVFISVGEKQFLVDTGPDLRQQLFRADIKKIDGVIFTHAHHDHTAGIDELRAYYFKSGHPIPILIAKDTGEELLHRYDFLFNPSPYGSRNLEKFVIQYLEKDKGTTVFEDTPISYFRYIQAGMGVYGYRIGSLAYLTDIKDFDLEIFDWLKGIKTVIISALREEPSSMHISIGQAVEFIEKTGADRGWITHISHELDHEKINQTLPDNVRLAYDGLTIYF